MGHKQESCWYQIKQQERSNSSPSENLDQEKVEGKASDPNYGPWMLVTRKKNLVRNGRAKSVFKESQDNDVSTKGKIVFKGVIRKGKEADVMEKGQNW